MAITTLDGALAGFKPPYALVKAGTTMEAAGVMHSMAYAPGAPGAMVAPSPGLAGAALTTYAGQIPWTNPSSGNKHLARLTMAANQIGTLFLCDRLWHNSGFTVTTTTAQTVNSAAWPARDRSASTNGSDVLLGIECSTATTNGSPVTNTTLSYTDQDGNAGATATMSAWPATAVAGTFVPFNLAAGDNGVRSVQSLTLGTSYGAGTIHLVAFRILAVMPIAVANVATELDLVRAGMPQLYNDSVPFLLWAASSTSSVTMTGQIVFTEG